VKLSRFKIRRAARLAKVTLIAMVIAVVAIQFAHIIARNIGMAHSLRRIQADETALRARKRQQERELMRLSDPMGSVPEIHDRLHLTTSHEAIIYLKRDRHSGP